MALLRRRIIKVYPHLTRQGRGGAGIAIPLISGKMGLLAYQVPITAVSGLPIATTPTDDMDEVHARYVQAVRDLFDQHKAHYGAAGAVLEIY